MREIARINQQPENQPNKAGKIIAILITTAVLALILSLIAWGIVAVWRAILG